MHGTDVLVIGPLEPLLPRPLRVRLGAAVAGAAALVGAALDVARERGAQVAELQSAVNREAANRLYPRMGFTLRETNVYRIVLT